MPEKKWHPVETLQATEFIFPTPGEPIPYAVIRLVPLGPDMRWRAVTWDEPRVLIGYSDDIRALAAAVHAYWIRNHGDHAPPNDKGWPLKRDGRKFRD